MKKAEFKGYKMNDIVGSGCGIFLLVVIIIHIILGFIPVTATLKGVEVPTEADEGEQVFVKTTQTQQLRFLHGQMKEGITHMVQFVQNTTAKELQKAV